MIRTTEFDYAKLKLFILSLLWRANATTHPIFEQVVLDQSQEMELRTLILSKNPGTCAQFAVILFKLDGSIPGYPAIDPRAGWIDPYVACSPPHTWVKFYVLGWLIFIKIDNGPLVAELGGVVLQPDVPLDIVLRDFASSGEFRQMWTMFLKPSSRSNTEGDNP